MANSDANPPLNNHMDDGTQHSLESSPETDTLGKTWTTEAPDPAVPRLVNPIVRMPAPGQDMSASQQVEADGTEGKDVEAGMSREDERNAQSEVRGERDSGNSGFPEEAIQEIQNPSEQSRIPYSAHVVLSEELLASRRSMQDPESFLTGNYDMHRLLATPSPESPLERFLTLNWAEDANNLYALVHRGDLDVTLEGLSIAETRQAIARALVRQATRNARRASSSDATGNLEQESQPDGEVPYR